MPDFKSLMGIRKSEKSDGSQKNSLIGRWIRSGVHVLAFSTVLGFAGGFFWFFDLFSHFRVQYFLAALVLGGVLFFFKSVRYASIAMVVAVANLVLLIPLYQGWDDPASSGRVYTALLYNVNTQSGSPEEVAKLIDETDPDFLVLEEIDSRWIEGVARATKRYSFSLAEPRSDNFGIGFWSKFPVAESELIYPGSAEVPTVLATVEIEEGNLQICGTHPVPPISADYSRMRDEQLAALPEFLSDSTPVLVLGDLNTTPWGYSFRVLLRESGLLNSMKGVGIQTSWPTGNWLLRIPLDHVLHSPEIQILDRRIGRDCGSDHLPVLVEFSFRSRETE